LTNKFTKQRLRAYEVNYDVQTNVLGTEEATNMQGQQYLKKSSFKQENIWLKTKASKKLNISFEEIEDFIILNQFKKKKSFQNSMERQLNHLIREQLHNINRSYPSKILSDKLADSIAKYLVCHAQDRRMLHGITQAQIAYNYIIRILYVFIDNQQRNLSFSRNMIRTFNRPHRL
jgi:hypothetical protein